MLHARSIIVPALLLAAAAGSGATAADDAKKPASDTITATRQGLEALKTDNALPGADNRLVLPSFDTPSLPLPPSLSPPVSTQPPQGAGLAAPASKSGSWLIDAMEKNAPQSANDSHNGKPAGSDYDSRTGTGLTTGAESGGPGESRAPDRTDPSSPSAAKGAPNPLGGFMAGWMTPRDFNLLLKPGETATASFGFSSLPTDTLGQALLPTGADFAGALPGGSLSTPAPLRPAGSLDHADNPYLQALSPPSRPSPGPAEMGVLQSTLSAPPMPAPVPVQMTAPAEPPASSVNDLPQILKRDDNAKYFPQLKHF